MHVRHHSCYRFDVNVDIVNGHDLLDLIGVGINWTGHRETERHHHRQQLLGKGKKIISDVAICTDFPALLLHAVLARNEIKSLFMLYGL